MNSVCEDCRTYGPVYTYSTFFVCIDCLGQRYRREGATLEIDEHDYVDDDEEVKS